MAGVGSTAVFVVTLLVGLCNPIVEGNKINLKVLYEWKDVCYNYPTADAENSAVTSGLYIPGKPYIVDTDVYYPEISSGYHEPASPKIFVATPRTLLGVPATLSTVSSKKYNGNNLLDPYPSWSWNQNPEQCAKERLVSVTRIKIDGCGRFWVLDDGKIGNNRVCPPQILAFDLSSDTVMYQYTIPDDQCTSSSYFTEFVLDITDSCDVAPFVYIADSKRSSLIVLDAQTNTSWRIQDKSMYPEKSCAEVTVNGVSFETMLGIEAMTLSPYSPNADRTLYFHAFNSRTVYSVSTSYLRNSSYFNSGCAPCVFQYSSMFTELSEQRNGLNVVEDVDNNGVLYYGRLDTCTLVSSNIQNGDYNEICTDNVLLDYIEGLKVVDNIYENYQELWIVTNRFQKVATCSIDRSEANYRILVGALNTRLTAGTVNSGATINDAAAEHQAIGSDNSNYGSGVAATDTMTTNSGYAGSASANQGQYNTGTINPGSVINITFAKQLTVGKQYGTGTTNSGQIVDGTAENQDNSAAYNSGYAEGVVAENQYNSGGTNSDYLGGGTAQNQYSSSSTNSGSTVEDSAASETSNSGYGTAGQNSGAEGYSAGTDNNGNTNSKYY